VGGRSPLPRTPQPRSDAPRISFENFLVRRLSEGTLVTSCYDWPGAEQDWKDAAIFLRGGFATGAPIRVAHQLMDQLAVPAQSDLVDRFTRDVPLPRPHSGLTHLIRRGPLVHQPAR
jgi:hypothetical protein